MVDDLAVARAVHVLALIHWVGGVAAVTTLVLPRARALPDAAEALRMFETFEQRFASQVRVSILFVGLSGLYMLMKLDAWAWFRQASFWWLDLMVVVWALFALMVFVLEPFFLHRRFHEFRLERQETGVRCGPPISCWHSGRCDDCNCCRRPRGGRSAALAFGGLEPR